MNAVSLPAAAWLRLDTALPPELRYLVHTLADRPLDPASKYAGCARLVSFVHNGFTVHATMAIVGPGGAPPGFEPEQCLGRTIAESEIASRVRPRANGTVEGQVVRRRPTGPDPMAVEFVQDLLLDELVRLRSIAPATMRPPEELSLALRYINALAFLTGWTAAEIESRMNARAAEQSVEKRQPPPAKGGAT